MEDENERPVCQCEDCGLKFRKGDEGDNEKFCLRCERISLIKDMSQEEYDQLEEAERGDQ